ncbi:uncharacterized protein [Eurosta solidaginis]|uniref:uncharacterized protein n=1 Tax=Eurosta solidaginis TaxID=178769 RepID=UPI003530A9A7
MMESLLSLKDHINRDEIEFRVDTEIDWSFVESFVDAFKPMAKYTKQLQIEQYIIGDFYRDWLICEVKLKRMTGNAFAAKLLESMEKRKEILMDNVAFLAGIYLDPRFNRRKVQCTKEKDLYKLAEVILAVPSSQVSVERGFSALSTILTKQRSRLSSNTINDLLMIKLNNILLEKVNF